MNPTTMLTRIPNRCAVDRRIRAGRRAGWSGAVVVAAWLVAGWFWGGAGVVLADPPIHPTAVPVLESRGSGDAGVAATAATAAPVGEEDPVQAGGGTEGLAAEGAGEGRGPGLERVRERLLEGEPGEGEGVDRAEFETRLEVARRMRRNGSQEGALRDLVALLKSRAPNDVKRPALLELASIAEDSGQMGRAQQILAQYARLFPQHPSVVEVYLRQGLLYREMGATDLALAKFHSVFSSALSQRFDQLDYYRRMVLQAQTEIADTYYLNGRWDMAREYLQRVMRLDAPRLTRMLVHYKLVRVLGEMGQHDQTAAVAAQFVQHYADAGQLAEVRFLLATALKKLGRNEEATVQVLKLLEAGRSVADEKPEHWRYWQKRAGNEIANQLYREGDYLSTLEIYRRLAELDASAAWQLPVWYQVGLVYERLEQSARATEIYDRIVAREEEAKADGSGANLSVVIEMARWRRGNLAWVQSATASVATLRPLPPPLPPSPSSGSSLVPSLASE